MRENSDEIGEYVVKDDRDVRVDAQPCAAVNPAIARECQWASHAAPFEMERWL